MDNIAFCQKGKRKDGAPLSILTAYIEHVPEALPDGTPAFAAAYQVIGKMARLCCGWVEG